MAPVPQEKDGLLAKKEISFCPFFFRLLTKDIIGGGNGGAKLWTRVEGKNADLTRVFFFSFTVDLTTVKRAVVGGLTNTGVGRGLVGPPPYPTHSQACSIYINESNKAHPHIHTQVPDLYFSCHFSCRANNLLPPPTPCLAGSLTMESGSSIDLSPLDLVAAILQGKADASSLLSLTRSTVSDGNGDLLVLLATSAALLVGLVAALVWRRSAAARTAEPPKPLLAKKEAEPEVDDGKRKVTVFFGTQTGTAEGFAKVGRLFMTSLPFLFVILRKLSLIFIFFRLQAFAEEAKARYEKAAFRILDLVICLFLTCLRPCELCDFWDRLGFLWCFLGWLCGRRWWVRREDEGGDFGLLLPSDVNYLEFLWFCVFDSFLDNLFCPGLIGWWWI